MNIIVNKALSDYSSVFPVIGEYLPVSHVKFWDDHWGNGDKKMF
jgi:hypothetical protein